jgi:hypothetical protein
MRCLECNGPVSAPGLLVAMEQREHFAMVRHAEVCTVCALRILPIFQKAGQNSMHWRQSVNCALCGHRYPIARLRFEIRDRAHLHIAICLECYEKIREHLLKFSNFVGFFEKEWQTLKNKTSQRVPWAKGTMVRVRQSAGGKLAGQVGCVGDFRCLVQPWFGYNVRFNRGMQHFFHERDLELVNINELAQQRRAASGASEPPSLEANGQSSSGDRAATPRSGAPPRQVSS